MGVAIIKENFLSLTAAEQQEFAQFILNYFIFLPKDTKIIGEDYPISPELRAELNKRSEEIHTGEATGFTWEEVKNDIKKQHGI